MQYIEDTLAVWPHVTPLVTHCGQCPQCGKVQSTHPAQMSIATGAAKDDVPPVVEG